MGWRTEEFDSQQEQEFILSTTASISAQEPAFSYFHELLYVAVNI
jgi:hypothetical protein